jgi:hypothetical protein
MIGQPATKGGMCARRLSYVTRKYIVGNKIRIVLRMTSCVDGSEVSTSTLKYGTLIFGAISASASLNAGTEGGTEAVAEIAKG